MTHSFLVSDDGTFSESARAVPHVRSHIEGLSDTAKTFSTNHIDGVNEHAVDGRVVEFCGAWPIHEVHDDSGRREKYVNPNYVHSNTVSDIVVECGCGALLTRSYNDEKYALLDTANHNEGCMPFDRHRARADMSEQRYDELLRLTRLGWRGPRIAARFGISADDIGSQVQQYGTTLTALREVYKREAALTYIELSRRELGREVAELYGHGPSTISRWASEYREEETAGLAPADD